GVARHENPPGKCQTGSLHRTRGTFVMRYSLTGPRLAARELIARRGAPAGPPSPAGRAAPRPAYSRRICGAAELLSSTEAPRAARAMTARCSAFCWTASKPPAVYDVN